MYNKEFRDIYNYLNEYSAHTVGVSEGFEDYWQHAADDLITISEKYQKSEFVVKMLAAAYSELQRRAREHEEADKERA